MFTDKTCQDLYKLIEENPRDWDTRLVLADRCEEIGDREMMLAQRYMSENEKRPYLYKSTQTYDWWLTEKPFGEGFYHLDHSIFCFMKNDCMLYKEFDCPYDADRALGKALVKLEKESDRV